MRFKQQIPVDHLPTIFETHDELYHDALSTKDAGLSSGCSLSQTQDDYLKSICQLAQPTFLCDTSSKTQDSSHADPSFRSPKQTHRAEPPSHVTVPRGRRKGNRLPVPADAFSRDDLTIAVNGLHYSQTRANNSDPFSWLFGQSDKGNHRSSQQFPPQRSQVIYPNEDNISGRSHWLSPDHAIAAANQAHAKQPSPPHGRAPSMGHC